MAGILAIYGNTCAQKSIIARQISRMTGYMVKHPGELAKTWVRGRKLTSVGELPEEDLRTIDDETRATATSTPLPMIMESGFMDAVLADLDNVLFVRLYSRDDVREKRFERRKEEGGGRTRQLGNSVADQDQNDAALRTRLYGATSCPSPALELDTSERSAEDCAREILDLFVARFG